MTSLTQKECTPTVDGAQAIKLAVSLNNDYDDLSSKHVSLNSVIDDLNTKNKDIITTFDSTDLSNVKKKNGSFSRLMEKFLKQRNEFITNINKNINEKYTKLNVYLMNDNREFTNINQYYQDITRQMTAESGLMVSRFQAVYEGINNDQVTKEQILQTCNTFYTPMIDEMKKHYTKLLHNNLNIITLYIDSIKNRFSSSDEIMDIGDLNDKRMKAMNKREQRYNTRNPENKILNEIRDILFL